VVRVEEKIVAQLPSLPPIFPPGQGCQEEP
jgi:hypothetical protein